MPVIWHPPRHAPDPELIPFEIPDDGLAYNYSGAILDGRYQLDRPIGPGGTSTVYSGKDLRTGARIAVKILNADMHEHLLGFFGQEGRVAARHTCPHLVQAIDFGKHEDCAFTVFKFVDGISLFNLGRDNPLPWRRVVRLAIQILSALDDLHARGLIHCDLHPSNVLVRRDLEGLDFVTVIDVGFAFVIPPKRITGAPEPTKYIFGLSRYIAPERRAGDAPSSRSDLYSLGVLLWELLTAQILPAYELDPGLAIPPVRTLAPGLDIPEALDAIVMRALSDVEYRFRDAQEMAQALRDVLEYALPPVFTAPTLPAAPPVTALPAPASTTSLAPAPDMLAIAAAATVALLPAPTLAADTAAPGPTTSSTPTPPSLGSPASTALSPTPASSPLAAPTTIQLAASAPSAIVTRKGLNALLSIAFASGSAVGVVGAQVAASGEAATDLVERQINLDDDLLEGASAPSLPSHHVPLAVPSPATTTLTPPAPASSAVVKPRIAIPPSRQVARARKGLLACNPPNAQLTAVVVIEREPDGELRVRFDGRELLGAFGDCALTVAQTLNLRADRPLRFKL